ncbi:APH domain-containing protein/ABC1 domain-containing protein [Cephalotus follicularis]|uniref:APH domain-containing protein/ABC1 domain-containing protein n=1 Tax=Cephalotus follicularis TaxID=3775 RepID=A0A1Q3D9E2_CEPFO|nr:APH domain-containing protein/ABC1 domain-containing protein [Cephalotus follicularis]
MAISLISSYTVPISLLRPAGSSETTKKSRSRSRRREKQLSVSGHLGDVVRKDVEFLRKGIGRGIEWANETFHIPLVSRRLEDILWLRNLEEHDAVPVHPRSWPQPCYPELSSMDLLMADLKALEAYVSYFYYLSKIWSKPLPEIYDPQDVTDYFGCRPHVVAFRLLEVFFSFATAAIRIRISGIRRSLISSSYEVIDGNISQQNFGIVLKETMLHLGPTFIKVGQSLSTRPDIIGTEICKALSELQDQIPPFPRTAAMKIIEEELGSPVESFFSYISEEPVAAASFGQVYCGSTLDGFSVAVKVQRPNLRHVVIRDIYILRLGLGLLQKLAKRKSDLRLYADELGKGLVGELDYMLEAANAFEFMEAHSRFSFIRVPKVFQHLSRKRVLTMEWMVGESPNDLFALSANKSNDNGSNYSERQKSDAKRRLLDLVSKGVEASLVQLLETGLMHADPHPGNILYLPSGQLGFLDFGLLCRMERKHQFAMLASIVHIVNGDWASLVRALTEMDVVRPDTNIRRVTMDLEEDLGEVQLKDGIPDVKFIRVLSKIWSVALKYHFRMPPYYTLVLRSLASLEGFAVAADQNFKTFEAAYPYVVHKLLTENSAETRKILHSVVLNKKKELQWQRFALFLRVGSTRKVLQRLVAPKSETSIDYLPYGANGNFDVANLVMRLLPSKNGAVLRRLLMTADGPSLVWPMVSKEAIFFRQQLCRAIADILYECVLDTCGQGVTATRYSSKFRLAGGVGSRELGTSSRFSTPIYTMIFRDRRLKVIFSKVFDSVRRDPILMLRFCWTCFVMFVTASALAFHRFLVSLSETYLGPVSYASQEFAIGT